MINLKDVSEGVWMGTVMAHFKVLPQNFPGGTEEIYDTSHSK
jgi:hypothetical protein